MIKFRKITQKIFSILTIRWMLIFITLIGTPIAVYFTIDHYRRTKKEAIFEKNYKEEKTKKDKLLDSLSKVKIWEQKDLTGEIGLKEISLKTKYINGELRYSFLAYFVGKSKLPSKPFWSDKIKIGFYDEDQFKIYEIDIYLNDMSGIVSTTGTRIGISHEGKREMDIEEYLRSKDYTIGWWF